MKIFILVTILVLSVLFFSDSSFGTPFLYDTQPKNNSFVLGGSQNFSINITDDNLNSSSVRLYIISLDAYNRGENWDVHTLTCVNISTEWKCSKVISFAIAGSDTIELFYFEANDTDGITGNNGTINNQLRFTLDRSPPVINFVNPTNNSYVSGNETISLTVTDGSSGIDNSTVEYSIDNSSWRLLNNMSMSLFETTWNTTIFSNNQTITLYAKAYDNVGNSLLTKINVTVDNEVPQLTVLSSLNGTLSGNIQLQINVSDTYSGTELGNVRYSVGNLDGFFGCMGSNFSAVCSIVINTANLQDGNYTLNFITTDRAGNSNISSNKIKISNTQPSISITEPVNNAFIKGGILVKVTVTNVEGVVRYVELSIQQSENITTKNMTCDSGFTNCNYSLATTTFADGGYTVKAKAINNLNLDVSSGIIVTIDNTKPSLTITQPTTAVKGDFEIKADVIDANLNQNKVLFNIFSFNGSLTCTPQTPSRFICSTAFNSKQLNDGKHILNVSAQDKSGNLVVEPKEVTITNQQATSVSSEGQVVTSPTETATGMPEAVKNQTLEQKKGIITLPHVTIPFRDEYILVGVVVTAVVVVIIILAIIVIQRTGKTIITEE